MAKELNEDTGFNVSIKTLLGIGFAMATIISMWFMLQADIEEAKTYIEKHFSKNYGNVNNFIFPISHSTATKWLNNFITKRFKQFGDYQDYTDKDNDYMFHSVLSSSINIGLINPSDILERIKKVKSKIRYFI